MLFHVTPKYLGEACLLLPRGQKNCKKVSTSPSIAQCLVALPETSVIEGHPLYVYRILDDSSFIPGEEWDTEATGEMVSEKKVSAVLNHIINAALVEVVYSFLFGNDSGIEMNVDHVLRIEYMKVRIKIVNQWLQNYGVID
jgi:hypothetical protein